MHDHATSSPADFSSFLSHEDAGVRGRAWAWQSALGLQVVEGLSPSAYLVESARHHIEGGISLELLCKLVDAFYRAQPASASESADRRVLDMVRMLGAKYELLPVALPPPVAAPEPANAPESAAALHLRQKRLLRTLGAQVLSVPELLHALRLSTRQSFMRVWLAPAMGQGLVKPFHPESPRHPQQKYLLTSKGKRFLKQLNSK